MQVRFQSGWRLASHSFMLWLIHLTTARPWLTVGCAVALALLGIGYTATSLEFVTSRNAMAPADAPYMQASEQIRQDFGSLDDLVVVIAPPTLERGKQFVQALASRLRADTQHVREVIHALDTSSLEGKKLLYLSPDELRTLQRRLEDAQNLIYDLADTPGLDPLLSSLNQEISRALVSHLTRGLLESSSATEPGAASARTEPVQALDITFLTELFSQMEAALREPTRDIFKSPWGSFFLDDDDIFAHESYLTSKDQRFLFVLVADRTTSDGFVKHTAALKALRAHIAEVQRDFPDVSAGVTGGDALSNDEMVAVQHDTVLATIIALVGVAVLFIVAFGQIGRPLLAVGMLMIALGWTLGLATLTVGHLNILSVSFLPMLIGLGIDVGIHLLARYGEERTRQWDFDAALHTAYLRTGPGVAVATVTTALAFYAVMLGDFRGLSELGFIAGSGLLLCLLSSFTVLPAMLALYERHRPAPAGIWAPSSAAPQCAWRPPAGLAVGLIALLTLVGILRLPLPTFDYNLLHLQAKNTESVVWENRLHDGSGRSSWYGLSVADSLSTLRQKQAQFEALPAVERVESVAALVPEGQDLRQSLIRDLAPYVADVSGAWTSPEPVDLNATRRLLQKIRFKLQRDTESWTPDKRPSEAELTSARQALLALQDRLDRVAPDIAQAALDRFQTHLMADFADKWAFLQQNLQPTPITLADVPEQLRQRFVGQSGRYLMQIFARENIWERDAMTAFVSQLEQVDRHVTGPPVIALQSIQQIQQGYVRGGLYALVAIVGMMLLVLGRLRATLLALVPAVLGGLWTLIGMRWLGVDWNMANLIIVPLFIGMAVDDGIHLVHRLQEEPESSRSPLAHSTGKAIVLTSLTTMVGFGSLMVARHSGIFSLGLLSTLAVGATLVATLVALPLVWRLFAGGSLAARPQPVPQTAALPAVGEVARHGDDPDDTSVVTTRALMPPTIVIMDSAVNDLGGRDRTHRERSPAHR
jgi:hopanoid biosynthesis associated RND transporter like protein HpnN